MDYSESNIKDLSLDQLSMVQVESAVEAFNGFALLLGKEWIEAYFQGVQSPIFVLYITSIWKDWMLVRTLNGSSELLKRWRAGINAHGVASEVHVLAHLLRYGAIVELFPPVRNRVCDCRFRLPDHENWIYTEISRRGLSKVRQHGEEILLKVAEAARKAMPGFHGKVAILRTPSHHELEKLIAWLGSINAHDSCLEDLAVFYTDSLESVAVGSDEYMSKLVPEPRLFATSSANGGVGTACLQISDEAAQQVLETEAAQLPTDHPGVIFLDLSSMGRNYRYWGPLIQRRLQPSINTRISAVVLFRISRSVSGVEMNGEVLINPHTKNPISSSMIPILQMIGNGNQSVA